MISVLYVDDEPDLLDIASIYLSGDGRFLIDTVSSGDEALLRLREKSFDAIVSDYQMPGMNGIGFLKLVRASGDKTPFIIFTGRGREEVVIEALNEGADFYLQKGGEPAAQYAELAHKIQVAVGRRETEAALAESLGKISLITEFLPDATLAVDQDKKVITWNRAMEELTRVPACDVLGKGGGEYRIPFEGSGKPHLVDLLFGETAGGQGDVPEIRREGDNLVIEVFCPGLKAGKGAYVWAKASPLRNTEGRVTGAIECIRDITERKQVEGALHSLVVATTGVTGREFFQKAAEWLTGYTGADIALFSEIGKDGIARSLAMLADGEEVTGYEYDLAGTPCEEASKKGFCHFARDVSSLYPADPDLVTFSVSGYAGVPVRNPNGEVLGIICVLSHGPLDLPPIMETVMELLSLRASAELERWRAETRLAASEEKYRLIAENTADNIWIFDMDLKLRYISPSVFRMKGFTVEESMAQDLREMMTPSSYDSLIRRFESEMALEMTGTADPGRSVEFETEEYCRDGSVITVENSARLLHDCDGVPVGILGISRDITERRKADEALRKSEERLALAIEGAELGTWDWDIPTGEIRVNDEWVRMLGYTRDEFVPHISTWESLIHPQDKGPVFSALEDHLNGVSPVYETEHRLLTRNGDWLWVLDKGKVIRRDGSGKPLRASGTHLNITARKKALAALEEAHKKLNLLSTVTRHDITNQLAVLTGNLQVAHDAQCGQAPGKYVEKALLSAERIDAMIRFMKTYEDIGARAPSWEDVRALITDAQAGAGGFGIALENQVPGGVMIYADPLIRKVFHNLIDNAVRHGGTTTEICFSSTVNDGILIIICEDNGCGVPESDKEKIFSRGYGKNTGLGLFLSREILSITGITIIENGKPGGGARFEIHVQGDSYRVPGPRPGPQENPGKPGMAP